MEKGLNPSVRSVHGVIRITIRKGGGGFTFTYINIVIRNERGL